MKLLATTKPVIAMVHFPGLPGRPRHDRAGGRARLLDVVGRDLEALQDARVDGAVMVDELVAAFLSRRPPPGPSPAQVAGRITHVVVGYVSREGGPMPGVPETIALFRRAGLRLAIASSSPERLIDAVCARLKLDIDVRCSALDEPRGKPARDVYLAAARRLRLSPARCLAVEDSPAGVVAASAAGIRCLAVPDPLLAGDPRYRLADLVLPSLTELTEPLLRTLTQ